MRDDEGPIASITVPAEGMVGVLVPEAEVVLTAPGFARLERLDVQVGDRVREGDVVAALDVREERHELAAATAAWEASKAELERLELELQKARETRSDSEQLEGVVAGVELREHRYAERLAAARKRSASASLRQQRSTVEDASAKIVEAQLRAPFAGAISRRYVDAGATLELGKPVVQLISDARLVRFAVPEERSAALRLGGAVQVEFVDEGLKVRGEVAAIAPEIDAGTRLLFAEARLEPGDGFLQALRVGTVGQVEFVER
ncbi:efflux RND transporter periplasmic adaptor subunit [Nannocystis sp. SCPEA4]|uniref:efflux RND transporter periplasmic adaptor subunit n=1 Tax=Nannocystis sp. SCPEA4 TaxID=2996787 RepID=UPI00227175B6|nr:efflux RND transporter periplasmic adaptor subunit [Nannocystis sp. SCPEA4]MCY1060079.1 efflux RND transporter periplasmic adaptor subunit [Nannocystis sp. SCPEA4]